MNKYLVILVLVLLFSGCVQDSVGGAINTLAKTSESSCVPSLEVCDGIDNDCDSSVDEGELCEEGNCVEGSCGFDEQFNSAVENFYIEAGLGDSQFKSVVSEETKEHNFKGYIIELKNEPVVKFKLNKDKDPLEKRSVSSYKADLVEKQNALEAQVKELVPSAEVKSRFLNVFNGFSVENISEEEVWQLESLPEVKKVYLNYEVQTNLMDSVPLINADDVWLMQDSNGNYITGEGISIGIIDTGVDYTHSDLGGCFGAGCKVTGGWNFVNNNTDPMDDMGHGTHVAAIAAGNGVLQGVAPQAKIYAYKVLNSSGFGYSDDVIAAIERAVDPNQDGDFSDHLDVINLSLGGSGNPDDAKSQAIDNAVNAGVIAVVSAGNSGPNENTIGSPGTARKAITVGATYKKAYEPFWFYCSSGEMTPCGFCNYEGMVYCNNWGDEYASIDQITSFSSRGPVLLVNSERKIETLLKPDVVAPGAIICAARYDSVFPEGQHPYYYPCLDEEHVQIAGTSMATPIVSGAVALIKQMHSDWTPEQIKTVLKNTADDLGEKITTQGYGKINAFKAININDPQIASLNQLFFYSHYFDVIGTASGNNFEKYLLQYGPGLNPSSWTTIYESNEPVTEGTLYSHFDYSSFSNGKYIIKLEVFNNQGEKSEDKSLLYVDHQIHEGFPAPVKDSWGRNARWGGFTPVIEDINGDGKDEIIILGNNRLNIINDQGNLNFFDESNFEELISSVSSNGPVPPSTIGYLDNNKKEILVNGADIFDFDNFGFKIRCFKNFLDTGSLNENWPPQACPSNENFVPGLANQSNRPVSAFWNGIMGDIDGDGYEEYISPYGLTTLDEGNYRAAIAVFDNASNLVWTNIIEPTESINQHITFIIGSLSIADIDNNGKKEVLGLTREWSSGVFTTVEYLHIWDENGNEMSGFPIKIGDSYVQGNSPVLADLDNDGDLEIGLIYDGYVFDYYEGFGKGTISFFNYDGSVEWEFTADNQLLFISMAIGDVDNDGFPEIAFGDISSLTGISKLYLLDHKGVLKQGWPKEVSGSIWVSPVIGDIDGDGYQDILTTNYNGYVYGFNKDGATIQGFPKKMDSSSQSGVAIGDIDGDGLVEIVAASEEGFVYVWDMNGDYNPEKLDWPQFHHDAQHTGLYEPYVPICSDGTLYGECSENKPFYCNDEGSLVKKCDVCGCPIRQVCKVDKGLRPYCVSDLNPIK